MQFPEVIAFTELIHKYKPINIITKKKDSNKYHILYTGIISKRLKTEKDAKSLLYPDKLKKRQFTVLKQRFVQMLSDVYLSFDFSEIDIFLKSGYQKALSKNFKNWAAVKVLPENGLKQASTRLYEQILKSSLKYDQIELSLLILKDLKLKYGMYSNNSRKYEKYRHKYYEIKKLYDLKEKAEELYISLGQLITKSKAYSYNEVVKGYLVKIEILLSESKNIDSFYLKFFLYNSAYYAYLIKKDIDSQIRICNQALKFFKRRPNFKNVGVFSFSQKAGVTYLAKKDYTKAYSYLTNCIKIDLNEGSLAWLYIRKYTENLGISKKPSFIF